MDVAREMVVARPRDPNALRTKAMVQLRTGDDKAALSTLRTLTEVTPESPQAYYMLATVQLKRKQNKAARGSLQQALALTADYPAAQLALGRIDIAEKDYDAALAIATTLQENNPGAAFGDELKGDVHSGRNESSQAAEAYSQAYKKVPSAQLAAKRYHALANSGETERAHEALRGWLAVQPADIAVRAMLATSLQTQGMNAQAIEEYLLLLEQDPDNIAALNNIAWLYQDAGNPEGLKYAERAHALLPGRPEVTDTLGWLLVQNGETSRGLLLLQEAALKAPHIPDIRYHMVIALNQAGRRDEARKELDRLLKRGKTFPDIDKARALQEQWGG